MSSSSQNIYFIFLPSEKLIWYIPIIQTNISKLWEDDKKGKLLFLFLMFWTWITQIEDPEYQNRGPGALKSRTWRTPIVDLEYSSRGPGEPLYAHRSGCRSTNLRTGWKQDPAVRSVYLLLHFEPNLLRSWTPSLSISVSLLCKFNYYPQSL